MDQMSDLEKLLHMINMQITRLDGLLVQDYLSELDKDLVAAKQRGFIECRVDIQTCIRDANLRLLKGYEK